MSFGNKEVKSGGVVPLNKKEILQRRDGIGPGAVEVVIR
jgi:hypothetical protein